MVDNPLPLPAASLRQPAHSLMGRNPGGRKILTSRENTVGPAWCLPLNFTRNSGI